jgi:magnesium transporter
VLINCVTDQGGKKLAAGSIDEISEDLERPGCFFWVALRDASAEALSKTCVFMGWRLGKATWL